MVLGVLILSGYTTQRLLRLVRNHELARHEIVALLQRPLGVATHFCLY